MSKTEKYSFWQSPLWQEILQKSKQADVSLLEIGGNRIYIERRHIWKGFTGLYILGIDSALVTEELLNEISQKIRQKGDLFLQVEPLGEKHKAQIKKHRGGFNLNIPYLCSVLCALCFSRKAPFRRFLEPVTAILNLDGTTEESLLGNFAEKGRYNIRLAEKRGVQTRWSTKQTLKQDLKIFYTLLAETTARDGFSGNSLKYYQDFIETLMQYNAGGLLLAEKDGTIHAGGVFVYWNEQAIYYYGASSSNPEIRRDMATYLVQWEAIREALRRDCAIYDFLGISPNGKGKLAGVTEFKLRFNPEKKFLPKEQIVVYRPLVLLLLRCISRLRKFIR